MAEKISLVFLGTGSAIPTARRNHPAVLLRYKAENILVDCGEGTQRQFRKAKVNPCKVTRILISHWHGDHFLGLPGLFQTLMLNGYNRKLEIYGPRGSKAKVKQILDLISRGKIDLDLEIKEISGGKFFDSDEFYLEAVEVEHDCPALAFAFVVKEKMRLDKKKLEKVLHHLVYPRDRTSGAKIPNSPLIGELTKGKVVEIGGKRVDGKKLMYREAERRVAFVMDSRVCDNAVKISRGADVLVSEATFSKEEGELLKERAHLSSEDAAKIAKRAKVGKLVLIHLSQRYEGIPKVILGEAAAVFKNVSVPEDLDRMEL